MTTKYTKDQLKEFSEFCIRHDLHFGNHVEFDSAIATYFTFDPFDESNGGILCEQQRTDIWLPYAYW